MKHIILAGLSLLAALEVMADGFVLTAHVPGLPKGCKVELRTEDGDPLAETRTDEGGFVLSGQVEHIMLAELCINDKPSYAEGEYPQERGIKLMVEEDAELTLEAACPDSIPLLYEPGGSPLFLEPCVRVKGGPAQEHYQAWRNWIYDAERARWQAEHLEWVWQFRNRKLKLDTSLLQESMETAVAAAQAAEEQMNTMFIERHPDYAVSLLLQQERLNKVFAYDDAELDSMLVRFKGNEDRHGYERLAGRIGKLRRFTRGTRYTDFDVRTEGGEELRFSDFVKPGVWNYVDFWASWCGPCRAAIPAVKKLYEKSEGGINIVSVSVDKKAEDWRQAMAQEQMPWRQVIVRPEMMKVLQESYKLSSIPYLLVIDPEGRVRMATHSPAEADAFLMKQLND